MKAVISYDDVRCYAGDTDCSTGLIADFAEKSTPASPTRRDKSCPTIPQDLPIKINLTDQSGLYSATIKKRPPQVGL